MEKQLLKAGDPLVFSQVAIIVDSIKNKIKNYSLLGHTEWIVDQVSAVNIAGTLVGTSFKADLAFNYTVIPGKELELISLQEGKSGQFDNGLGEPVHEGLSHMGVHVENIESYISGNTILRDDLLLQISETFHHTGTERRYRYALIDTRDSLGFISKLIERVS